jgi:glycolate oxidase FAD binding subunit
MAVLAPSSAEELAAELSSAAAANRTITLIGKNSKPGMGGPCLPSEVTVSTERLSRVLEYEPNDLTIGVESGMPFSELQAFLSGNRQMIAIDPPFHEQSTVGGIIAANLSGPMRRGYGTARDLVIGMTFATLEGKVVSTGGMVVKNVAGLDVGKIMVGSFGTLAAITRINFRVHPLPESRRTFLFVMPDLDAAVTKRDEVIRGPLRPISIDLLSPSATARLGTRGYVLAVRAAGCDRVLDRYERELAGSEVLRDKAEDEWWARVVSFTPAYLESEPSGIVLRVSTPIADLAPLLHSTAGPVVARAGSGIAYIHLTEWAAVNTLWQQAASNLWNIVVEHAPDSIRTSQELWQISSAPGADQSFAMMEKIKLMFDPAYLMNRRRMYGRI